jgi:hypothetical protein
MTKEHDRRTSCPYADTIKSNTNLRDEVAALRLDMERGFAGLEKTQAVQAEQMRAFVGNGIKDAIRSGLAQARGQWTPWQALLGIAGPILAALVALGAFLQGWIGGH